MDALDWLSDHATELVTGRDPAQERAAAAAGAAGNSARSEVYGQQAQLRADLPYGTDPASITIVDSWASWSHPQIKAMVDGLGSGTLHDAALGWETLGKSIVSTFGEFKAEMAQIVTTGWEGQAADAATASTTSYAERAASLGTAARYMGTKVTEAATGAEQTRAMVPEPVSFSVSEGLLTALANPVLGAADIYKQRTAQTEAHAAAVRVMTSVYTPVYQQSDAGIPTLDSSSSSSTQPGAPAPTAPGPGVSPPNQTAPGTGNPPRGATHLSWTGSTPSSPSGTMPSNPADPGPSGPAAAPLPGAASTPSTPTGPPGGQWQPVDPAPLQSTTVPPAQIGSAGWTPPVSAAGSVGGSSGYGFGESGGPGAGGLGGSGHGSTGSGAYGSGRYGSGASGYSSTGSGGSARSGYGRGGSGGGAYGSGAGAGAGGSGPGGFGSGPGGSTGAGAVGAGAGGGSGAGAGSTVAGGAAAGARGAAGGGMGAGGRGARGEEDFEHDTPSYLITQENGSELVGELPKVAPAVIGE